MKNDNPNNMSNDDLEKDMQQLSSENNLTGNQEHVNKSTATEGTLIEPEQDHHKEISEDLGPQKGGEDGSLPDSEELSLREEEDSFRDPDKISG